MKFKWLIYTLSFKNMKSYATNSTGVAFFFKRLKNNFKKELVDPYYGDLSFSENLKSLPRFSSAGFSIISDF